jgi:hypothetical protein
MRSREDFLTHRENIHHNPVRAHLCQVAEDYPFSSAHQRSTSTPETELSQQR